MSHQNKKSSRWKNITIDSNEELNKMRDRNENISRNEDQREKRDGKKQKFKNVENRKKILCGLKKREKNTGYAKN